MERFRPSPEPAPSKIFYNRTGNLANSTRLDELKASEFMHLVAMRRNFVIIDSDKKPDADSVSVATNILAFRAVEPMTKLLETRFSPKKFYTLVGKFDLYHPHYQIEIHEQEIDKAVRSTSPVDTTDYSQQFLRLLNQSVKSGLQDGLFAEKLSLRTQFFNYLPYIGWLIGANSQHSWQRVANLEQVILLASINFAGLVVITPAIRLLDLLSNKLKIIEDGPRTWKDIFLPAVPVHKWAFGRFWLAKHGEKLIVPQRAEPSNS